jgi:hypothetical protein
MLTRGSAHTRRAPHQFWGCTRACNPKRVIARSNATKQSSGARSTPEKCSQDQPRVSGFLKRACRHAAGLLRSARNDGVYAFPKYGTM